MTALSGRLLQRKKGRSDSFRLIGKIEEGRGPRVERPVLGEDQYFVKSIADRHPQPSMSRRNSRQQP
jgi:hypothetical protein